jgi:uncharacterized protein (DUF1501 family)
MITSRRSLLRGAALGGLLAGLPRGLRLGFAGTAQAATQSQVLIFCLLRGGMDGLNLVGPADDPNLNAARPATLVLQATGADAGFPLANGPSSNDWRLHPSAPELDALYTAGNLAFVHATGIPDASRSHFQMQALAEAGVADPTLISSAGGWIGRYAEAASFAGGTFAAVSAEPALPNSMLDDPQALSLPNPAQFNLGSSLRATYLTSAYQSAPGIIGAQGRTAINAVGAFAQVNAGYTPPPAGTYQSDPFEDALSVIAELIVLDVGLQIAEVEYDQVWDTHFDQQPRFAAAVATFSKGLGDFYADIAKRANPNNVTVVVMSEFGRHVQSNASAGTDHGHGNVMLVLGGMVNGGRIYGQWPGLAPSVLDLGDVPVTTDSRSVLVEAMTTWRTDFPSGLFPDLTPTAPLGLFRS